MIRLFMLTFGVLGWAWFEMSGGSEFEPGQNSLAMMAAVEATPIDDDAPAETVSRAETGSTLLASLTTSPKAEPIEARPEPEPAKPVVYATPIISDAPAATNDTSVIGTPKPAKVASAGDYRIVTGSRVNVRNGPGTSHAVVTKLQRGDEVEVMQDSGAGWVKLRSLEGNRVGWMSADFLKLASN